MHMREEEPAAMPVQPAAPGARALPREALQLDDQEVLDGKPGEQDQTF